MSKRPKMPIYYVIDFEQLIPCYLIKEGYIPCDSYREDPQDEYYGAYDRRHSCIRGFVEEDVFIIKEVAKKELKIRIEQKFNDDIRYLIKDRNNRLKKLEE